MFRKPDSLKGCKDLHVVAGHFEISTIKLSTRTKGKSFAGLLLGADCGTKPCILRDCYPHRKTSKMGQMSVRVVHSHVRFGSIACLFVNDMLGRFVGGLASDVIILLYDSFTWSHTDNHKNTHIYTHVYIISEAIKRPSYKPTINLHIQEELSAKAVYKP